MDWILVSMGIGVLVPFTLLYKRKEKWCTDKLRWLITGILFLIGFIGFVFTLNYSPHHFEFYFLCIPLVYNCFDRWFKNLSFKKYDRDFYLYLSNSDEIDTRLFAKNPHVKGFDRLFSALLIIIIAGLMLLGAVIFGNK